MDCFVGNIQRAVIGGDVSISALSDRGLLPGHRPRKRLSRWLFQYPLFRIVDCFGTVYIGGDAEVTFQYPLFRIVDCFIIQCALHGVSTKFQYPLFRIVDCFRNNII